MASKFLLIIYINNDNNNIITTITIIIILQEVIFMTFLRWLGGFVLLFWLIGLIFRIGGSFINLLLVVAAIVFIVDALFGRRKNM